MLRACISYAEEKDYTISTHGLKLAGLSLFVAIVQSIHASMYMNSTDNTLNKYIRNMRVFVITYSQFLL